MRYVLFLVALLATNSVEAQQMVMECKGNLLNSGTNETIMVDSTQSVPYNVLISVAIKHAHGTGWVNMGPGECSWLADENGNPRKMWSFEPTQWILPLNYLGNTSTSNGRFTLFLYGSAGSPVIRFNGNSVSDPSVNRGPYLFPKIFDNAPEDYTNTIFSAGAEYYVWGTILNGTFHATDIRGLPE